MATTPPLAERDALIAAHLKLVGEVRQRITEYAQAYWDALGSWRDTDVQLFVDDLVPRVQAGQLTIANLTDAYLARMTGAGLAGPIDVTDLRGVPDEQVFTRPAVEMRTQLAGGKTFTDAKKASDLRLKSLVGTAMQMAFTRQAHRSMGISNREAYRRVLNGSGDCALCVIASTQRYWKKKLLPIHPGCDCSVAPLAPGEAVSQVIDPDLLEAAHNQVETLTGIADRGGRAPDYRKLIVTREHGEIGPLLTWDGQHFTGPEDLH